MIANVQAIESEKQSLESEKQTIELEKESLEQENQNLKTDKISPPPFYFIVTNLCISRSVILC